MTYTVLYERDSQIMVSKKMSLDLAMKLCDQFRKRGLVAWVEDAENNRVY